MLFVRTITISIKLTPGACLFAGHRLQRYRSRFWQQIKKLSKCE